MKYLILLPLSFITIYCASCQDKEVEEVVTIIDPEIPKSPDDLVSAGVIEVIHEGKTTRYDQLPAAGVIMDVQADKIEVNIGIDKDNYFYFKLEGSNISQNPLGTYPTFFDRDLDNKRSGSFSKHGKDVGYPAPSLVRGTITVTTFDPDGLIVASFKGTDYES